MKQPRSRWWYAAIATIVFAFVDQFNLFLKLIGWKRFISEWLIVLGIRNALEVATCFHRRRHHASLRIQARCARAGDCASRSGAGSRSQRLLRCRC